MAGNSAEATAKVSGAFVFDNTYQELTITANEESPTNANSIIYTFEFSEDVTGFAKEYITITNNGIAVPEDNIGTLTTVSARKYTLTVTNTESCVQNVRVEEGKCEDSAGNANNTYSCSVTIDHDKPKLTITANPTSPTNAEEITYTITFSESVTGLEISDASGDITVTNGTKESLTPLGTKVTQNRKDYYSQYSLVVKNTGTCVQKVEVNAGKCTDLAGNSNEAGTSENIIVDRTLPTLAVVTPGNDPKPAQSYTVTVKIADTGGSGLAVGTKIEYAWSKSNSTPPTIWTEKSITGYSAEAGEATAEITQFLFVVVETIVSGFLISIM